MFPPFSAQHQETLAPSSSLPEPNWAILDKLFQLSCVTFLFFKMAKTSVPASVGIKWMSRVGVLAGVRLACLRSSSPCQKRQDGRAHPPEAWTSMMYWCRSCPCWMTSKVMLFMASFRSVWRCSRCSASVRSSVLKSFICRSKSSFQASNSAVTCKGTTVSPGSQTRERLRGGSLTD